MTLTTLEHFAAIPNTRNGEVTKCKPLKNALAHARPRTFPSQQMRMQMINFLSAPRAGIDHGSKTCIAGVRAAIRHANLCCELCSQYHHPPSYRRVLRRAIDKRCNMPARNEEHMYGRRRFGIVKSAECIIFVYFPARYFARGNFAEKTVIHIDGFSLMFTDHC